LDLCLGQPKTPPKALKSIFAFSLASMDDPSSLKIEDDGYLRYTGLSLAGEAIGLTGYISDRRFLGLPIR